MKCTIPEISWHNREPVLSIDLHPLNEKFYRLATGGADCHVLIWQLNICDNGAVKMDALSDLTRHQRAVNSVRWSPDGHHLATADDDANIIIWQLKTDNIPLLEGETNDKEVWIVKRVMRGHKEDIYDLCWSPNGLKLLSGSIDNTAILWDFTKGKNEAILTDHKGFVQGVSWDPKGQYIATISTDRVCRIYDSSGKQIKARIQKGILPVSSNHYLHNREVKYFHDDTFKSFFRRLDFSPDGNLLVVPSGRVEIEDSKKVFNGTYIFTVESWSRPVAVLPSGNQCSTVVRFCPILFELHDDGPEAFVALPYRMIFAVGTDHDVILYDTQQVLPFAYFRDIHYTRLTDLTWSKDGLLLMASSTDGFCALITFEPDELGLQYVKCESEAEDSVLNISGCEELEKDDNPSTSQIKEIVTPVKPRKPSLLEKWTIKTPKRNKNKESSTSHVEKTDKDSFPVKRKETDNSNPVNILTPKRIKPVPVIDNSSSNKKPGSTVKVNNDSSPLSDAMKKSTKSGPLLNFLKAGSPINKEGTKSPQGTKSGESIHLVVDEIEARDAWKCEKDVPLNQKDENEVMVLDDSTEDFCLQLEDTSTNTEAIPKTDKADQSDSKESNLKKDDAEICSLESKKNMDSGSNGLKENISQAIEEAVDCSNFEEIDIKVSQKPEEKAVTGTAISKTSVKKRVPLITLSSPKHKSK